MKYGHEYSQLLASEDFPAEWVSSAISYRQLKKCIKKIQQELDSLGLDTSTLQHLQSVFRVDTPKSKPDGSRSTFVPELWVATDTHTGEFLDAQLTEATKNHLLQLSQENGNGSSVPVTSDGDSEGTSNGASNAVISAPSAQDGVRWTHIHLSTAAAFFNLLDPKLAELDAIQHAEEHRLEEMIADLGISVTALTEPAISKNGKVKAKRDVTVWREILALYIQHAVFFSPHERDRGSRGFLQAKSHLELFSKNLVTQGLVKGFKEKTSRVAFDQFVTINLDILKAMHFQEINMEAVRKILKKFDKRTALGAAKAYQSHTLSDTFAKSVGTKMCAAMSTKVVSIVPQVDDYSCPLCCTICWRPIRLECCNNIFCIRCMIKLQRSAANCPMCRSTSVITADSGSIDQERAAYLVKYFPAEVKEKQKANERAIGVDKYGEEFYKSPCSIM